MERYKLSIRKKKALAIIETVSLVFAICSIGLILLFLFTRIINLYIAIPVFSLCTFSLIIFFIRKGINKQIEQYYTVTLSKKVSYEQFNSILKIQKNSKTVEHYNSSVTTYENKYRTIRILSYYTDENEFDRTSFNNTKKMANQKFNNKYKVKHTDSIINISLVSRINIIFTSNINEDVGKIINTFADKYTEMASTLLHFIVIDNKLYIPYFKGNDLSNVFIYDYLVKQIYNLLNMS